MEHKIPVCCQDGEEMLRSEIRYLQERIQELKRRLPENSTGAYNHAPRFAELAPCYQRVSNNKE